VQKNYPMPFLLLQAMMAAPLALIVIFLPVTIIVYTLLRLTDRVRGKRKNADERRLIKRRSVHLLLAMLAGILACTYFIYSWSQPEAGRFT
jgi:amino acid transporter